MKVEKEYTIYYIVHAISVLDKDLLSQILRPLAKSVGDKVKIAQYLHDFKRIILYELDFDDDYYEVVHGLCEKEGCTHYSYTFTANYSHVNFTLKIEETFNGIEIIQ
jgi:CRISPR/Cas system-associated endonuclease Cas3-HD